VLIFYKKETNIRNNYVDYYDNYDVHAYHYITFYYTIHIKRKFMDSVKQDYQRIILLTDLRNRTNHGPKRIRFYLSRRCHSVRRV